MPQRHELPAVPAQMSRRSRGPGDTRDVCRLDLAQHGLGLLAQSARRDREHRPAESRQPRTPPFGPFWSIAEAVPFDGIHLEQEPRFRQTRVGTHVGATRIGQRPIPTRFGQDPASMNEVAQLTLGGRSTTGGDVGHGAAGQRAACRRADRQIGDQIVWRRQAALDDLAKQSTHRAENVLVPARVEGSPRGRRARERANVAQIRQVPRAPDPREGDRCSLDVLGNQYLGSITRRHVLHAICAARRRAGDHGPGAGVQQRRSDQMTLLQVPGECGVHALHDPLPPAAAAEGMSKRRGRHTAREHLAAREKSILSGRELREFRGHSHPWSITGRAIPGRGASRRCGR